MAKFAYTLLLALFVARIAAETYTNPPCITAVPSMNACAKRWDSIRADCTKRNTVNTVWPGPCECAYFANDLPCFDDQALCAAQVWTQVPQWFRDGVSSCIMKDAAYTVRANLGAAVGVMGNPFTVAGLAGKATRTVDAGVVTGAPASIGASASVASVSASVSATSIAVTQKDEGLTGGAKAGFGVGICVGVALIGVVAWLILRNRRKTAVQSQDTEKRAPLPVELHDDEARIHMTDGQMVYPKCELQGTPAPRYELGVRTSTWLVELPEKNSNRNSRMRP
jgi:hypothetical protein